MTAVGCNVAIRDKKDTKDSGWEVCPQVKEQNGPCPQVKEQKDPMVRLVRWAAMGNEEEPIAADQQVDQQVDRIPAGTAGLD